MLEKIKDLFRWNKVNVKFAPVTTFDAAYSQLGVPKAKSDEQFADAASNILWVYVAVRAIAETAAMLPLRIYQKNAKGDKEVTSGFQYDLLNNPSNFETPVQFRQAMFGSFAFSGNSYVYIDLDNDELWNLHPQDVAISADKTKFIKSYIYRPKDLNTMLVDPSVMIHVKSFNPQSYFYGLSPLQAAWSQVNYLDKDDRFWEVFWKEGGRLQGIFTSDGSISSESVERLKEQLKQAYTGVKKMQANMVLDNGLKFQQLGVSQKDAQLLEKAKTTREEILAAYKVPPSIAGILDNANYSNMEVQERLFYQFGILPMLRLFEEAFSSHPVMSENGKLRFQFDTSDIDVLNQNEKLIAETGAILVKSGQMTQNEVRDRYWDLPAMADGNELAPVQAPSSNPFNVGLSLEVPKKKEIELTALVPNKPRKPYKSFRTHETRMDIAKAFDSQLEKKDNVLAADVGAIFRKQKEVVLNNIRQNLKSFGRVSYRKDQIDDLLQGMGIFNKDLADAIKSSGEDIMGEFGPQTQAEITRMLPDGSLAEPRWNFNDGRVQRFLRERSVTMGGAINEETLRMVRDEMAFLISQDANLAEITDAISNMFDGMEGWRASRIARTETAAAANEANEIALQQNSDIVGGKEWITANDAQVRDSHLIEGQVVALDEPFILASGENIYYPMEPGAPPEEVINCRCTTVPVLKLEEIA